MKKLLPLALVLCSLPALAQSAKPSSSSASSASNQASVAEVNQLLTLLNTREQMKTMIEGMKEQMKRGQFQGFEMSLQKKGVVLNAEERERAKSRLDAMTDEMFKQMPYDEMMAATAEIYRKHFTSQDIAALVAFYRSPAGQKFLKEMPSLLQESTRAGGDIMSERMPELLSGVEEQMNDLVGEFAKNPPASTKKQ
jgi:hypothetical protein